MPRGVSRKKHPEMYADKTTAKSVGTSRRVKTGGRTANRPTIDASQALNDITLLANARHLIADSARVNDSLTDKIDQVIGHLVDELINQITPPTAVEAAPALAEGAVVDRSGEPTPRWNPPPVPPRPAVGAPEGRLA